MTDDDNKTDQDPVEPTAKQIAQGETQGIDEQTRESLAAWFSLPPPPDAPATDKSDSASEGAPPIVKPARKTPSMEDIDPVLKQRLEAHQDSKTSFPADLGKPPAKLEKFDFSQWRIPDVDSIDRYRPPWIKDALQEEVPQALLRDLFRPIFYFSRELVPTNVGPDLEGSNLREESRAIMNTSFQVDMTLGASTLMQTRRREWQETLAFPWEEAKPEKPAELINQTRGLAEFFASFGK